MENDEKMRSLMFTLTYMLMKRRRDLTSAETRRRNEAQQRVRQRQYFLQRQKRTLMVIPTESVCVSGDIYPSRMQISSTVPS